MGEKFVVIIGERMMVDDICGYCCRCLLVGLCLLL